MLKTVKDTNCKNCGAPLQHNICDYCGTNYNSLDLSKLNQYNVSTACTYTEYLAEQVGRSISYHDYLADQLRHII